MSALRAAAKQGSIGFARSVSRTHVGRVRQINEDRVFDCPERSLWAVADGLGGHHGGDLAAQGVVNALRSAAHTSDELTPASVLQAMAAANADIFDTITGAGATVVALSVHGRMAQIAWAGDSRCYRLRDGAVQLLTRDHSVVQELVDAGLITAIAAATHPQANVITRALGIAGECEIDTRLVDVQPTDRFLLCSDGLSRTLRLDAFDDRPLDTLADALLAAALDRDGSDNITLTLVEFGEASRG